MSACPEISTADIAAFQSDGAICLRGLFRDWVEVIAAGIERNLQAPGPYAGNVVAAGEPGSFFEDYCNWRRIPEFEAVVTASPAAAAAATLMRSASAQFFHEHVLVKEPGTHKPTPWHQDIPYYFVDGEQTVSFWIPVDPVREATLRLIAGSHRWEEWVRPVRWKDDSGFYEGDARRYRDAPDPDREPGMTVLEWALEPGDAVLFDFRTAHGARGNPGGGRRRALSLRWLGDDARYVERPGRTSPPYPDHGMRPGQCLREDWFPVLWPAA
ncbi:phytanoyl-CoA dioxygenase family protein [Chromobacterium sp.]|uniref:phytanoyl-CoA dioxygenase family protein n=1 Tax=Chromobacterium sp. TaxID=306190 RepID=UPI0035AF7864